MALSLRYLWLDVLLRDCETFIRTQSGNGGQGDLVSRIAAARDALLELDAADEWHEREEALEITE